ncbi:MAG: transposase, partial [Candidatus Electrothrix sp. AUS1_2]|nr:transposase [Candidatus Electrothrix sp. AUS1_2]
MPDRVTMLGISRWTEKGGSYRTIQRFFKTKIDWAKVQWIFICTYLRKDPGDILLAGDEVVTPKAGKETYGLGRFFSSVYNKPIPGMCHLQLSLIPVEEEKSYPLTTRQIQQNKKAKPSRKKPSESKSERKKKSGRPKGSRNQNRRDVELTETQGILQSNIRQALALIDNRLTLRFFVYDGALGHNNGVRLVRQCGLHLISKLRYNSALYLPYDGPYSGKGPHKKYGDRLEYTNIPKQYLKSSIIEDDIRTEIYQMTTHHKKFVNQLNAVIIVKTNLKTLKSAHVVLFSSDLELACDKLVKYYRLRFQIEFNFRDAKQYWGLDDFMNIKEQQV